jgi:WD40 repeat protein
MAHQGLVFTVDWHPEDRNMIASGGRDRMIKVWDLTNISKPYATIQTIASVARIQWRPSFRNHIASSASLMDFNVHIWSVSLWVGAIALDSKSHYSVSRDIKRPYFPWASFRGHKDVATGIQWYQNSGEMLLSCGKDSLLLKQSVADAYRPIQEMCATSVSWTASGNVAVVHDTINRHETEYVLSTSLLLL